MQQVQQTSSNLCNLQGFGEVCFSFFQYAKIQIRPLYNGITAGDTREKTAGFADTSERRKEKKWKKKQT